MSRSCIVVGAGPAGLAAAYRLANAGVRVTVLESAPQPGGRTRTERVGDFVVNTGAGLVTSFYDVTLALLQELHLETVAPREHAACVATRFGKFPFDLGSSRALLRFPLVPWFEKLRALWLFSRLALGKRTHFADLTALARADRGENLERWGRRNLGNAAYDYLLRGALESLYYYDAQEASAAVGRALVQHSQRWQVLMLREGTGALCETLARRLEVRTGCWASAVETRDDGVAVHHSGGTVEADRVILALPAPAAAHLDGIPAEDRNVLGSVRYAPNVTLFFGYERPVTAQYHSVTQTGPGRHPIASIFMMSRWVPSYVPEGKEMIAIYSSGWRAAELLEREPGRIAATLRADAEEVFGRMADPDWIRIYPHPEASVVPPPGHFRKMLGFLARPRERILYAGDWITGSTIEGALRTGFAAADRFLRSDGR